MSVCLIGLGANVGDRAATLDTAMEALRMEPGVEVIRQSFWHATKPIGGANLTCEFLNGAALLDTSLEPLQLLKRLQRIEDSLGRQRSERWVNRALDLDLLLYGEETVDTPELVVPHPRMSFRRFVLVPAVEIAGDSVHPTIGWSLARMLGHLDTGADCLAIMSPDELVRRDLANCITRHFAASRIAPPWDDAKWPAAKTTWVAISDAKEHAGGRIPKLSVLLDAAADGCDWASLARQPGRGPTLRIPSRPSVDVTTEVFAAVESVWPHLGRLAGERIK